MKVVKDFWKDHKYFPVLVSFFVEIVHTPSGFKDVSLCAIMSSVAGKKAIKDGLSAMQSNVKMSLTLHSFKNRVCSLDLQRGLARGRGCWE